MNWPLPSVEDDLYRSVLKYRYLFSCKTFRSIILAMVPYVEVKIKNEMKDAGYGAILHNGWSKFSQHYVALFATYNKTVSVIE